MHPVDSTITFASWVLQSHKDALVLTLGISGFDVRRVLVDPSSSVDLLQMFNGATTTSQGDVVLLVQVGLVTLNVQFSMVEDLSHSNAIMGRALLHKMKIVPSTYHPMVSYLTEEGQIDLLGS
ncbi:hypothetical protein CK203_114434 [Vitis vinifera]|uniref:Uncharacterized protein n=1 Tax=Vitis vinifera TaxID=29760 RepID=A0A438CF08_VITVI|nr:hypothetical protein CK203_114434 [Vitis vinifera]